ncbi:MAG: divalent-cation tolerance protein CutA [Rhodobacteraceae bacterium]|nr:divalent-cation tolerance protein CutA [Paracoccaceae bacterium]
MTGLLEVEVTCPDADVARDIARACLSARLAACANILPGVESLFHWQGDIAAEGEALLRLKSQEAHFDALAAMIARHHPYDLPAITALSVRRAGPRVQGWVEAETGGRAAAESL